MADDVTAARGEDSADTGAPVPAAPPAEAESRGRHARRKGHRPFWQELALLTVVAVVVAVVTKAFLVQLFFIPSGSMEETLQIGDRVAVNKVVYRFSDIKRGDVVVFNGADSFTPETTVAEPTNPVAKLTRSIGSALGIAPTSERDFIKRVVGVGGDRVACCDDPQGRVTVNGVPLDEPYLYPGNKPSGQKFDVVVPDGKLFVMGDHRSASSDSRSHLGDPGGGMVPEDRVIGKAFAVVWPPSNIGGIRRPDTYDQPGLNASGADALTLAAPAAAFLAVAAVRWPGRSARRRR